VIPVAEIVYRPYAAGDLGAIVELDRECFAPPFRFSREAMRRYVEAENAWVTVAEARGELAGFAVLHRERTERYEVGYVVTIDVARASRRRGVGKRMLEDGEAWVSGFGGAAVLLHVFLGNEAAIRFYERLSYVRAGIERGFYGAGLDGALYWKVL